MYTSYYTFNDTFIAISVEWPHSPARKKILVSCCVRSNSTAFHGFNAAAALLLGVQQS